MIKIVVTENGKHHWLSFPEVGNHNVSVKIDEHIYRHLDYEIEWARKNNTRYLNKEEVISYCNNYLEINKIKYKECNKCKTKKIQSDFYKNQAFRYNYDNTCKKCQSEISMRYSKISKDIENKKVVDRKTYLMKDNHNKLYKIGYSKNPKARESTLQSEKPSIKMVKVWNKDIEQELHNLYAEFRIRGEWFDLTPIQVRYICTHF